MKFILHAVSSKPGSLIINAETLLAEFHSRRLALGRGHGQYNFCVVSHGDLHRYSHVNVELHVTLRLNGPAKSHHFHREVIEALQCPDRQFREVDGHQVDERGA